MKSKLIIIAAAVILIVTVVLLYYCISHEEVYGLINNNWFITFILIGIITLTLTGGSLLIYRSNRLKIRAQEEARQSMEKLGLQERIRESEMRYRAITERKKLEESLRESEEKYRTLVESLPDYVMRYDRQHRHIFANSRTFRDYNMTAEEFLGKTHQELGFDPHLCDLWEKAIDNAFETGQPQVEEFEWKDAFEVKRSLEWRVYPEKAKDGSIETLVGVSRDITDSKRTGEEIVMLAHSLRSINECVSITDMEDKILFVNLSFLETYGYNANELIGKCMSIVWSPNNPPELVEEILPATLRGGWIGELWNKRKDGSEFQIRLSTTTVRNKEGKALGLIGVATDITERKQAELKIKYQANLLKSVSDAILATDRQFNIQYWNSVAEKQYGWTSEEVTGDHFTKFIQPQYITDSRRDVMRKIMHKGTWSGELLHNRRDGTLFPVLASISEVRNAEGQLLGHIAVNRDITERKKTEEENVMLANSLKIVNECVCITDMENNFQFVNESFSKTYGYNANELIGKHISIIRSSDTAPASVEEILSATIHGGWQGELCNKRKNGSEFPVYLSTSIINDKNNKHLGLIGVSTDITERKHTEEEMKVSKIQLEQLYSHLTDVRENERAGISREIHDELGQSLTALKMDLNWTKENVANKMLFDKKLNGMINIVTETIRKVQKISSDLRPGMLDDLGLIPAIEWYCQEFEERTGLQCHLELKEIPSLNSKNKLTLFRILQEGLTNIIRHANAKSVEVKLYSSPGKIFLKINDDGIGISKEKINSKDSIGLIGMKERLRQFNGTLEIFSSKNNGTSLIISIPVVN